MKPYRATHPLTQPQLADYLLISRSLVAQYEAGERRLPFKAREKLTRLEIALQKNDRTITANAELRLRQMAEEEKEALEEQQAILQMELRVITIKLKEAGKKYDKAMQMLWAIPVLLHQLPEGKEGIFEEKWLQATESGILRKLKPYGIAMRRFQLRKAAMEKQLTVVQSLLAVYHTDKAK